MSVAYDNPMTVDALMTADELFDLPDDGWCYELVRGELRKMSPAGTKHGNVAAKIVFSLMSYLQHNMLGEVYTAEPGFRIARNPDTVRVPDVAFIRTVRVVDTVKFFEGPPDIAFEVVSPGDRYSEIEEKALDWIRAGTQAVVIVDPRRKSARIHRTAGPMDVPDVIEIEDVIHGWKLPLAQLF